MEPTNYQTSQSDVLAQPERPDFLKILCILSFVSCGLWILICALGTMVLGLDEASVEKAWEQMVESNPQFEGVEPMQFMHDFGMWCIYVLIANIFSLVGVIMMWRLEKIGFFIYTLAELSTHFFKLEAGSQENQSMLGTVILVCLDLLFIGMYAVNLKYMNKRTNNTYIQSGS